MTETDTPTAVDRYVTACNKARSDLLALYEEHKGDGGWRAVGAVLSRESAIEISGTMAYRVAVEGYQPRDDAIRLVLGLPQLNKKMAAELLTDLVAREPVEG